MDPREKVIEIVQALPEAEALPVAGLHLKLVVRGKGFGWYMENHHGSGRIAINCKAPPGVAEELVRRDPVSFHIPKYVGNKGWAGIWLDVPSVDWEQVRDLLIEAYCMAAPKSLVNRL